MYVVFLSYSLRLIFYYSLHFYDDCICVFHFLFSLELPWIVLARHNTIVLLQVAEYCYIFGLSHTLKHHTVLLG